MKMALAGSILLISVLGFLNVYAFVMITDLEASKNELAKQVDDYEIAMIQKANQILLLEYQIDELERKNAGLNDLNETYVELQRQYNDLIFHYNLLNQPALNFTTYADLEMEFALDYSTYYYQDSVSGNITVNYVNGTAFEGRVSLGFNLAGVGGVDFWFDIQGFARFSLSPPVFEYGPGMYTVTLWSLQTSAGYYINIPHANQPSITVEAK
jgi:hypothetical protein